MKAETKIWYNTLALATFLLSCCQAIAKETETNSSALKHLARNAVDAPVLGLNGQVSSVRIAIPAESQVSLLSSTRMTEDIDLKRMSEWALNYLSETPRKHLGYQPAFQVFPLKCPPMPEGEDPVVSCDTDARMDWEWYYMRDISGSAKGLAVEAAFHKRMRDYIDPNGLVWSAPGCFNEGNGSAQYQKKDYVIHIWGATKILKSLSEDFIRTQNSQSRNLAKKVMLGLKKLATWDGKERCWFACGMGAFRPDGSVVPNFWNPHPAPIVESLITYWQATGDSEGLAFARAYAEGIIQGAQPDGIRFEEDGCFHFQTAKDYPYKRVDKTGSNQVLIAKDAYAHSHATTHNLWGLAHFGVVTGERKYIEFAKRSWDWMLSRGTGTGWFPAMPDSVDETCLISDMMSIASLIGYSGSLEYYDYVERYMRNYISNLQFIVTPEFESYYRQLNKDCGAEAIEKCLTDVRKLQGGIIGLSGLNDYENMLLERHGFRMPGCCPPEGMRAIYTTWLNTIEQRQKSSFGPGGVYVNMGFNRNSKWGRVVSFMPDHGRLTAVAAVRDTFWLRPPHWAPRNEVRAFLNTNRIPVDWVNGYVRFNAKSGDELSITYPMIEFTHHVEGLWPQTAPDLKMTFYWLGNMVTSVDPPATKTPLFTGKPRLLPPAPNYN